MYVLAVVRSDQRLGLGIAAGSEPRHSSGMDHDRAARDRLRRCIALLTAVLVVVERRAARRVPYLDAEPVVAVLATVDDGNEEAVARSSVHLAGSLVVGLRVVAVHDQPGIRRGLEREVRSLEIEGGVPTRQGRVRQVLLFEGEVGL